MAIADRWDSIKPWPVYLLAAVLPVSLALVGVAKALILMAALACLATSSGRARLGQDMRRLPVLALLLGALAAMSLSLVWTRVPVSEALVALAKHAKLLLVPFLILLLTSRAQVVRALRILVIVQVMVLLSAYLLCLGVDLPWVQDNERLSLGTVFSSYLDQSLMTVGLAALAWHLRADLGLVRWRWAAPLLCAAAALNVLLFLPGRSGQFALVVVIAISLYRGLPSGRRWLALAVPALALGAAMLASPEFSSRAMLVKTEVDGYLAGDRNPASSAGTRLNFWVQSVHAISERPLLGHGVGSWNAAYRQLEGAGLRPEFAQLRNPHQEFLLWGVELGIPGALLLAGLMLAMILAAHQLPPAAREAGIAFLVVVISACLLNCSLFDALIGDYFCAGIGLLLALGIRGEGSATG